MKKTRSPGLDAFLKGRPEGGPALTGKAHMREALNALPQSEHEATSCAATPSPEASAALFGFDDDEFSFGFGPAVAVTGKLVFKD